MANFLSLISALLAVTLSASSAAANPGQKPILPVLTSRLPFNSGEKLTYDISWSDIIQAGTAVMEVREETEPSGRAVYHIVSTAHSTGLVAKFYTVSDRIDSIIDARSLHPFIFRLDQTHGSRHKLREMVFNPEQGTVTVSSNGKQESFPVPDDVQDSLSSLYFVRTKRDFSIGKPLRVDVHEDGKTWAVEIQTLGREKLKTKFGELDTIKVKTYPRYDGVFQNKGEIYIWFTDDDRKIPVLMKSTISIGSIVATLVDLQTGEKSK